MTEEEFYIYQDEHDGERFVEICLDDEGENHVLLSMKQVDGRWVLASLSPPGDFAPFYHFNDIGKHTRLTCVTEWHNMVPPDFIAVDPVGMTPTQPNENRRRIGVEGWTSDYVWSREHRDWVLKEVNA
jgi:hypothetical protein